MRPGLDFNEEIALTGAARALLRAAPALQLVMGRPADMFDPAAPANLELVVTGIDAAQTPVELALTVQVCAPSEEIARRIATAVCGQLDVAVLDTRHGRYVTVGGRLDDFEADGDGAFGWLTYMIEGRLEGR